MQIAINRMLAMFALGAALAPCAALAQQPQERPRWQQMSPAERERMMQERQARRAQREGQKGDGQPERRHLSVDERQQLRRDIGDHGRDIYRDRPGGPRPPRR